MPYIETNDARLYYEEAGSGTPILLIAPGGMRSAISFWQAMAWNPLEQLAGSYRVVAMDQRNAGNSRGAVKADHGWHTYTADQLAVVDSLGIDRFHVMGMCIGGPYAMGLIEQAPERVISAVLFQSIGLMNDASNRETFYDMFDGWANDLRRSSGDEPNIARSDADWLKFRSNMYDGDKFLFNLGDDFVRDCTTPLCVLEGNDIYHPRETSQRIRDLASDVVYVEQWKESEVRDTAMGQVRDFLSAH